MFASLNIVSPHYMHPHIAGTNRFSIALLAFVWLFGLVCERVLAVSFTCKPRPSEASVHFLLSSSGSAAGSRQYQGASITDPKISEPPLHNGTSHHQYFHL